MFTIGLGDNVETEALVAMASTPDDAHFTADAEDLADRISPALLRAIAGSESNYHETDDARELADLFLRMAEALGCPPTGTRP